MPEPYSWTKLSKSANSHNLSARSGHTLTLQGSDLVCFGGSDGRRNERGMPVPNDDLHVITLAHGMEIYSFTDYDFSKMTINGYLGVTNTNVNQTGLLPVRTIRRPFSTIIVWWYLAVFTHRLRSRSSTTCGSWTPGLGYGHHVARPLSSRLYKHRFGGSLKATKARKLPQTREKVKRTSTIAFWPPLPR